MFFNKRKEDNKINKSDAYKIVYNDLINCSLFAGKYDAINGSQSFMHGIETIMGYIAEEVSPAEHKRFDELFSENMTLSLEKAGIA